MAEIQAQLERREIKLASGAALQRTPQLSSLHEVREEKKEVDWVECRNFISDWKADPESAKEDLVFKSDRELMQRFGPPTEVWSNEKGTHWVYGEDYNDLTEKYETEIFVRLRDGYVTLVAVESP